ncbi:MAG: sigma 54-interacting transcriptional regulator [Planctomycetota bacterium]
MKPEKTVIPSIYTEPFVDGYIKGSAINTVIQHLLEILPAPLPPVIQTHIHLFDAYAGRRPAKETLEEAREIFDWNISDPLYAFLFIDMWVVTCLHEGHIEEARALWHRATLLIQKTDPPELRARVLTLQGGIEGAAGNKALREEGYRKAFEILPDGPRRVIVFLAFAIFLAQQGRGSEALPEAARLESTGRRYPRFHYYRFVHAVETGRTDVADRLLLEFDTFRYAMPEREEAANWRTILSLLTGRWREEGERLTESLPPSERNEILTWTAATQCLLDGDADGALRQARAYTERDPMAHLHVGFQSLTLVRAELASRNTEAAMRILGNRWKSGYRNYLDDFFLARAYWLRGNHDHAALAMAETLRAVERYDAAKRLDFELRLALELSPGDVLALGRAAAAARSGAGAAADFPVIEESRGVERLEGAGAATRDIRQTIRRYAPLDTLVLVTGETGTGKELVARALHEESPRARAPFLAVNCGAIPENLLESELFGHARGAFTGAVAAHRGIFEEAGKGTVFLDEIGNIPPRLQMALLRVLETGEIRPVGSAANRKIACRIVAATNADLTAMAGRAAFRRDLLFRLNRLEIRLPPLRERPEDILPLADYFLSEGRRDGQRPVMSEDVRRRLTLHAWPGNIRELRNVIERMRLLHSDKLSYDTADLDLRAETPDPPAAPESPLATDAPVTDPERPEETRPVVRVPETGISTPHAPSATGDVGEFLRGGRSPLRRLERLRALFREHGPLTRLEISVILRIAKGTATRDLAALRAEGFIEKVTPTVSPRTHYFQLKAQDRGSGLVDRDSQKKPVPFKSV